MATKKRIQAVGYARRSTDLQERSIPDQKAYVEKWADQNGYHILRWYIDDAISGASAKGRVAFDQLITAAENGRDFEAILCYDISRFSRGGTNETGYYLHRLQLAGVEAVFPADSIPEGDEGELLQGVKSWQAKQYTVKLSRDVIRGYISNVTIRRSAPGGIAPYGYDKQHQTTNGQILRTMRWMADGRKQEVGPDGKLVRILEKNETIKKAKSDIVRLVPSTPERVETIQRIFRLYLAGYGGHHIAARLNEDGIASYTGVKWVSRQIRGVLENPVYKGALVWNRRTCGRFHGVDGEGNLRPKRNYTSTTNPKEDWYLVEGVHEPLISPEDFEKAQQARSRRSYMGGKARSTDRALLSGLIICSHCNHSFFKKYVNYRQDGIRKKYYYYTDSGYARGGKALCKLTNVPMEPLDLWVLQQIKRAILGDHNSAKQAVDAFVKRALSGKETPDDTSGIQKDLEATHRRIKATLAMLADPAFEGLEELKMTLAELKRRRDQLQDKLGTAKPAAIVSLRPSQLRDWAFDKLSAIDQLIAAPTASVEARSLVHAYVHRIEIDPYAKQGVLYLPKEVYGFFTQDFCSRGSHEDFRGAVKIKGEA